MLVAGDFTVPSQVQKVPDGVPSFMQFISVKETESDAYGHNPEAHTEKMHLLLYLNSRHWNETRDKKSLVVSNYGGGSSGSKKTYQSRKYNRMAFFADLLSPGRVCCKIMDTQHESLRFFDNMIHGAHGIGWIYILEEYVYVRPNAPGRCLVRLVVFSPVHGRLNFPTALSSLSNEQTPTFESAPRQYQLHNRAARSHARVPSGMQCFQGHPAGAAGAARNGGHQVLCLP